MPTLTFSCACGWQEDKRVRFGVSSVPCPSCEGTAAQESVYRIGFSGFARTPSSERDWSKDFVRFQEATAENKPLPTYRQVKARALELKRKGAKDANDVDVKRL